MPKDSLPEKLAEKTSQDWSQRTGRSDAILTLGPVTVTMCEEEGASRMRIFTAKRIREFQGSDPVELFRRRQGIVENMKKLAEKQRECGH